MKNDVICIIGMHRSGTSMVAQLLQQAGLYLGPEDRMLSADSANVDGHFEHTGFLDINNKLLQRFGGSWEVPPQMMPGWELEPRLDDIRAQAQSLVGSFTDHTPWGWKEPRTTILLPFWKAIVPELRFVICVRNPLDVAKSLASRNHMAMAYGISLWNRYMRAAIEESECYPRQLTFYEDYFDCGTVEVRRLIEFCGLEWRPGSSDGGIHDELRHHYTRATELLEESTVSLHAKLLYIGLRALLAWPSGPALVGRRSSREIGLLLKCLDEFHNLGELGQLKSALYEKSCQLEAKDLETVSLKNQLNELEQHADRLQRFSDAVRRTWAYRFYRNIVRPLKST